MVGIKGSTSGIFFMSACVPACVPVYVCELNSWELKVTLRVQRVRGVSTQDVTEVKR